MYTRKKILGLPGQHKAWYGLGQIRIRSFDINYIEKRDFGGMACAASFERPKSEKRFLGN